MASLWREAGPLAIAVGLLIAARVLVVEGAARLVPRRWRALGASERVVLTWGGLRGALTVALALALPAETPHRELLIVLAFGVVLFTLVVQGLTLGPLLRALGLVGVPPLAGPAGSGGPSETRAGAAGPREAMQNMASDVNAVLDEYRRQRGR